MSHEESQSETLHELPLYAEPCPRCIPDPARSEKVDSWKAANRVTFRLLEALESLRDLRISLSDLASQSHPNEDHRRIKRISTPLFSFAWAIRNLCKEFIDHPDHYGHPSKEFLSQIQGFHDEMERSVPVSGNSPLRVVRNKIDAHVDPDVVHSPSAVWDHVELSNFLPWLACSLTMFSQLLVLDYYGWTCESSRPDVWRLMSVEGTLVNFLMVNGEPSHIISISMVESPKIAVAKELNEVITLYNTLLRSPS